MPLSHVRQADTLAFEQEVAGHNSRHVANLLPAFVNVMKKAQAKTRRFCLNVHCRSMRSSRCFVEKCRMYREKGVGVCEFGLSRIC